MSRKKTIPKIPYKTSLKEKAQKLRTQSTPAEKHFWNTLRKMPFYQEFTFNRQKPLGLYIVDFYCHPLQLVIEIDGHSHGEKKQKKHDEDRDRFLKSQGLQVVRFTNKDVLDNIEGVMGHLEAIIKSKT